MRLSGWRAEAPARASADAKVSGVLEPVLAALGAGSDPHGWAIWGEDVVTRWTYLAPTPAGLVVAFVRVNIPGEGPRVSAKVIRWGRVQLGELAMEMQAGHRLLSFSVETQILKGADAEADRIAAFALVLLAAVDGRAPDFEKALAAGDAMRNGRSVAPAGGKVRGTRAGTKAATSSARASKALAGSDPTPTRTRTRRTG